MVSLYGRHVERRQHLYLPGERRGVFNPQGARNTDEVIITESVIDSAALWSAGLRNVIPIYGTTGLTEEIVEHLRECRVKRAVLMLDSDEAGRAAAVEIAAKLREASIEARSVELPAKDPSMKRKINRGTGVNRRPPIPQPRAPTPALWLTIGGRRLSKQMIAQRITGYARQANLKATPHTFRHSCASHLLRGGASIRHVQRLLGHRGLETTEIYTHVEVQDLRHVVEQASKS